MKKLYKILNVTQIDGDLWEVFYETWTGCYCTKVTKHVRLRSDRKPGIKELKNKFG